MAKAKEPSIKDRLASIEQLVARLESSDVELEEAMLAFEEGTRLVKETQALLTACEQRVQTLVEKDGEIQADRLITDEDESEDTGSGK